MGKIYIIKDNNGEEKKLVSLEYVEQIIKQIGDILVNKTNVSINLGTAKEYEELDIKDDISDLCNSNDLDNIKNNIEEYKSLLSTEIDKPSKFEVDQKIESIKTDNDKHLEEIFMRIINTPNVLNKLRDISLFFQENNNKDTIIDILANKVNKEDFDNHTTSKFHLTNNDRAALNLLLQVVKDGIDWNNQDNNSLVSIKNKPKSLPANGGNADTVSDYSIKYLLNNSKYITVFGSDSDWNESCDVVFNNNGEKNTELFNENINSKINNSMLLKRGDYEFSNKLYLVAKNDNLTIGGYGNNVTKLHSDEIYMSNAEVKDLQICDSTVIIYNNNNISNVIFKCCTIIFENSTGNNITNCRIVDCNTTITGLFTYNIIALNRYIKSNPIKYIGGNNIINNIEMN